MRHFNKFWRTKYLFFKSKWKLVFSNRAWSDVHPTHTGPCYRGEMTSRGKEKLSHQKFYLHIPLNLDASILISQRTEEKNEDQHGVDGESRGFDLSHNQSLSNRSRRRTVERWCGFACIRIKRSDNSSRNVDLKTWLPGIASLQQLLHPQATASTAGHRKTPTPVGSLFLVEFLTREFWLQTNHRRNKLSSKLMFW